MMKKTSEDRLVQNARHGNRDALCELLRRHAPTVRRKLSAAIASQWRSVLDVDDIVQVSCLEVFLRIGQFQPRDPGCFEAWFMRIASNNLRDAVKGLQRAKRLPPTKRIGSQLPEDIAVALYEQVGVCTTTPSRHAAAAEIRGAIEAVLEQLPADYASVIRLYDLGELATAEVAKQMKRSIGAIYMLRKRALEHLRNMIGNAESQFLAA